MPQHVAETTGFSMTGRLVDTVSTKVELEVVVDEPLQGRAVFFMVAPKVLDEQLMEILSSQARAVKSPWRR